MCQAFFVRAGLAEREQRRSESRPVSAFCRHLPNSTLIGYDEPAMIDLRCFPGKECFQGVE
jgi:hypothetical protein